MIVRDFRKTDLPDLIRIGRAFSAAANQPEVVDSDLEKTLLNIASGGVLKVGDCDGVCGVIGALVYPHYWNASVLVAQELFWWVDEEYRGTSLGLKLLRSAERSCKAAGAHSLTMLCLDDLEGARVASFYRKCGYKPQEQTFVKVL